MFFFGTTSTVIQPKHSSVNMHIDFFRACCFAVFRLMIIYVALQMSRSGLFHPVFFRAHGLWTSTEATLEMSGPNYADVEMVHVASNSFVTKENE
jgi:hypothetical protein